jgi:hypothetical protein
MLGGFGGIALDALGGVMVLSTSSAENFLGSLVIDQQIFELYTQIQYFKEILGHVRIILELLYSSATFCSWVSCLCLSSPNSLSSMCHSIAKHNPIVYF